MKKVIIIALIVSAVFSNRMFAGGFPNAKSFNSNTAELPLITGWITSDIPAEGYSAGKTYTITVAVPGTGIKGFELIPQTEAGIFVGSLSALSNTKVIDNGSTVTHKSSTLANPAVYQFKWTAPAISSGKVTFNGAFKFDNNLKALSTLEANEATSGITPQKTGKNISVYPNPANGKFTVEYQINSDTKTKIEITDITGKTVMVLKNDNQRAGVYNYSYNIENRLNNGIYFIRVQTVENVYNQKIVINK